MNSHNQFSITKKWSILSQTCSIEYREKVSLTKYEEIFIKLIAANKGIISVSKLGLLLGFGMENIPEKQIYKDDAEIEIFFSILTIVQNSGLLDIPDEYSSFLKNRTTTDRYPLVKLSYWGRVALGEGHKYAFFSGKFQVYDHMFLDSLESKYGFFPFHEIGLEGKILDSKKIAPYELKSNCNGDEYVLKEKAKSICTQTYRNKYLIDYIDLKEKTELFVDLSISLIKSDSINKINLGYRGSSNSRLNLLLNQALNKPLYNDLLSYSALQYLLEKSKKIDVEDLSKYAKHIDWTTILENPKLVWDNKLFEFLKNENHSTYTWSQVASFCPKELLVKELESFEDFFCWSTLTNEIDVSYIINNYKKHPWDVVELIERLSPENLEIFLITHPQNALFIEWESIIKNLSDEFILQNTETLSIPLKEITRTRESLCKTIISSNNTELLNRLDWGYISKEYNLSFILKNFAHIKLLLDFNVILSRILENFQIFKLFSVDKSFTDFLADRQKSTPDLFKISSFHPLLNLNETTIPLLDEFNLLSWGSGNISGVEANQNLIWNTKLFDLYNSKIESFSGETHASATISDLDTIEEYPNFNWDFATIASRKNFINDIAFIKKNDTNLPIVTLINNVASEFFIEEFRYFYTQSVQQEKLECLIERLNTFNIIDTLNILKTQKVYTLNLDWSKILGLSSPQKNQQAITFEETITQLLFKENLISALTKILSLEFILNNQTFDWDWKIITKEKISDEHSDYTNILNRYSKKIYWPHILQNRYSLNDFLNEESLSKLALLLSNSTKYKEESWSYITNKIPRLALWDIIDKTKNNSIYNWDWSTISKSQVGAINIKKLKEYKSNINWSEYSKNEVLKNFFKFDPSIYKNRNVWISDIIHVYLMPFLTNWDFKALSNIPDLINNQKIVETRQFVLKWDWNIISFRSPLLRIKRGNKYFLNKGILNRFKRRIAWSSLSKREDVIITRKDVTKYLDKNWDWKALSNNAKFELNFKFLLEHEGKGWDWKALTRRKYLNLRADDIRKLKEKDWDWNFLSDSKFSNSFIIDHKDKDWNWEIISRRKDLVFDENLLKIFSQKENIDWYEVIKSPELHFTLNILSILTNKPSLGSNDGTWDILSSNPNLDLSQKGKLLDKYKDFWNWQFLVKYNKISFEDVDFIFEYKDYFNWHQLSESISINDNTLSLFEDSLNWSIISNRINPTNENLTKHKLLLDWSVISRRQDIPFSIPMLKEFHSTWDWAELSNNLSIKSNDTFRNHVGTIFGNNTLLGLISETQIHGPFNSNWAGKIYHYSHLSNVLKILDEEKVKCRNAADKMNNCSGNIFKTRTDPWEFARFYFRPQTPTQFYNEYLGKDSGRYFHKWLNMEFPMCPIPIFIEINISGLLHLPIDKIWASRGNMQRRNIARGNGYNRLDKIISYMDFQNLYATKFDTTPKKHASQQEFLIMDSLDLSTINPNFIKILTPNKFYLDYLKSHPNIPKKYKSRLFIGGSSIFLNDNPVINIKDNNNYLKISYRKNHVSGTLILKSLIPIRQLQNHISGNITIVNNFTITARNLLEIQQYKNYKFELEFKDEGSNQNWLLYSNI